MALTNVGICNFGWKARDFALPGVDNQTWTLADVRGRHGTLVVFICNHCPYVQASIARIVEEANALKGLGIGTIAIMPNDTESYPQDSFDNMRVFARQHDFTFPYVIDETQAVARAYDAALHARFLRLQCEGRAAISRPARRHAHELHAGRAARALRSDEADRRDRQRAVGADREHGLLDQVEGLIDFLINQLVKRILHFFALELDTRF